jgi:predicted unusual protein kinase regulating ubiquinone biosynthesis (AarF/ABC1/UbiB family)
MVKKTTGDGLVGRGLRLGKLGFGLVGSYVSYQAQNLLLGESEKPERQARFQQKASRQVRREFGALKGPVMKLGQMLSMQTEILSEDAIQELATLQMRAPGMHPSLARAQFKSSLGKYPEELFREFEEESFAAASLGQVHRAVTKDGEKVAVKIQYPAIRTAIENDFKLLRSATLPGQWTGHISSALLDEVQRGILEETDYEREADNLEFFAKGLSALDFVTVPRVYRKLSTGRVLTMSFIEGGNLADFLKRNSSQASRDLLAIRLCEVYETQLQRLKALHADQHPGNYIFQPDGRIGLIDFGCVKRFSFDIEQMRSWYQRRIWNESDAAAQRFLKHVYGPDVSYGKARKMLPLLEKWSDVFYPKDPDADMIIDFNGKRLDPKVKELHRQIVIQTLRLKLINPEHAFLSRADIGIRYLLSETRARVNFSEIIRRVSAASRGPGIH